jgi:hypothetical protein
MKAVLAGSSYCRRGPSLTVNPFAQKVITCVTAAGGPAEAAGAAGASAAGAGVVPAAGAGSDDSPPAVVYPYKSNLKLQTLKPGNHIFRLKS